MLSKLWVFKYNNFVVLMDDKAIILNYLKLSVLNYGALTDAPPPSDYENTHMVMEVFPFHLVVLKHGSYCLLFGLRKF